jgi:hypothetical protein
VCWSVPSTNDGNVQGHTGPVNLLRINREGTRLFVTLNGAGKVVMFNIARPNRPQVMSVADLGADSAPARTPAWCGDAPRRSAVGPGRHEARTRRMRQLVHIRCSSSRV